MMPGGLPTPQSPDQLAPDDAAVHEEIDALFDLLRQPDTPPVGRISCHAAITAIGWCSGRTPVPVSQIVAERAVPMWQEEPVEAEDILDDYEYRVVVGSERACLPLDESMGDRSDAEKCWPTRTGWHRYEQASATYEKWKRLGWNPRLQRRWAGEIETVA